MKTSKTNLGCHEGYLHTMFEAMADHENFEIIVQAFLDSVKTEFDSIAVSGVSGIFGALIAKHLGKNLIVVRKLSDGSHSTFPVESGTLPGRYVIIDDLVASGRTVQKMNLRIQKFAKEYNTNAEFLGVFCWHSYACGSDHYWWHTNEKEFNESARRILDNE